MIWRAGLVTSLGQPVTDAPASEYTLLKILAIRPGADIGPDPHNGDGNRFFLSGGREPPERR